MKSFLIAGFPLVGTVLHFSPKSLGQSQDVRSGAVLMGAGPQPGGDNQGVTPPKKLKNVFSCYVQQQVIILFPRPRTTQRSPGREQHSTTTGYNHFTTPENIGWLWHCMGKTFCECCNQFSINLSANETLYLAYSTQQKRIFLACFTPNQVKP